ncbi:BEACH domain-containing protein lvsB [Diplonema papillatum]|nr:BEACH domain-containing protein lvsB [Diplonema papillatum]
MASERRGSAAADEVRADDAAALWAQIADFKTSSPRQRRHAVHVVNREIAHGFLHPAVMCEAAGSTGAFFEAVAFSLARHIQAFPHKANTKRIPGWIDHRTLSVRCTVATLNKIAVLITSQPHPSHGSTIRVALACLLILIKILSCHPSSWASLPPPADTADDSKGLHTPIRVAGLAFRPGMHSSAAGPSPPYAMQPFAHLVFKTVRCLLDVPWAAQWDEGDLAASCLTAPDTWLPFIECLPIAASACTLKSGPEEATIVREEWVASMGSLTRLATVSAASVQLLAVPPDAVGSPAGGTAARPTMEACLDVASYLLEVNPADSALRASNLLVSISLLESVVGCIVHCLSHNKVLVSSFARKMGYTIISTLLRRLSDGHDGKPHDLITTEQLQQAVHIPLVLLAISNAPMLTAKAVEEFARLGSAAIQAMDESRPRDPWRRLWGAGGPAMLRSTDDLLAAEAASDGPSEMSLAFRAAHPEESCDDPSVYDTMSSNGDSLNGQDEEFAGKFTVPVSHLSLETSELPWCNCETFGLLLHAFAKCDVDFRFRRLLHHIILFTLVRFPPQYLRQQDSDALWNHHPILQISVVYHTDMDAGMQNAFLSCVFGLFGYTLKRVNELIADGGNRATGAALLEQAFLFDLSSVVALLQPPGDDGCQLTLAAEGCGRWFLSGIERVLALVVRLQNDLSASGIYIALRKAHVCETIAGLLESGFGWNNQAFISKLLSVLYHQCKTDPSSTRHLLDHCHHVLHRLYALLIYLTPKNPTSHVHFNSVLPVLSLISGHHNIIGDLLVLLEIAPVGLSPDEVVSVLAERIRCPHCASADAKNEKKAGLGNPDTGVPTDVGYSTARCRHRQHAGLKPQVPASVEIVKESPLKKAVARRAISGAALRLLHTVAATPANFRTSNGFSRMGDICERDALTARSLAQVSLESLSPGEFLGVPPGTPADAVVARQLEAFKESEESEEDDKDLLWHLHGNILLYLAVVTAASSKGGATAFEEAGMGRRLDNIFTSATHVALPASRLLLSLGLLRLSVHATSVPVPDPDSCIESAVPYHDAAPEIRFELPADKHQSWFIQHPSTLVAALTMNTPVNGDPEEWWDMSSTMLRHLLGVVGKLVAVTVHNAVELHNHDFVSKILRTLLLPCKQAGDSVLTEALFSVVRDVGKHHCSTADVRTMLQYAIDDYLGKWCIGTFRAWTEAESPAKAGPQHFLAFPNRRDSNDTLLAPVAVLPKLACSPWPLPGKGCTTSFWIRFEALKNAPVAYVSAVSTFTNEDAVSMTIDMCLDSHPADGNAALVFRVASADDNEGTAVAMYTATPEQLHRLEPYQWYHVAVTHSLDVQERGVVHTFEVKLNGGLKPGTEGVAQVTVLSDRKERFKRFARKGGKLSCLVMGASLIEYLYLSPASGGDSSVQRVIGLLEADADEIQEAMGGMGSSCFASVQIGTLMLFWGGLTKWQVHLLHSVGRNYCGDLQEAMSNYHALGVLTSEVCATKDVALREAASHWHSNVVAMADGIRPTRNADRHSDFADKLIMLVSAKNSRSFVASKIVFGLRDRVRTSLPAANSNLNNTSSTSKSIPPDNRKAIGNRDHHPQFTAASNSNYSFSYPTAHSNSFARGMPVPSSGSVVTMETADAAATQSNNDENGGASPAPSSANDTSSNPPPARGDEDDDLERNGSSSAPPQHQPRLVKATNGRSNRPTISTPTSDDETGDSPDAQVTNASVHMDSTHARKVTADRIPYIRTQPDSRTASFRMIPLNVPGICCRSFKQTLRAYGGVQAIISLVSLSKTHELRVESLRLLVDLARYNAENTQFLMAEGYATLAWYLRKSRVVVDENILESCLAFCGVDTRNPAASVLQDTAAIRLLLLDWGIWCKAELPVQRLMLSTLAGLVSDHPLGRANRRLLIHTGAFSWLLRLTRAPISDADPSSFSIELQPEVLDLTTGLAGAWEGSPPCTASLRELLNYFVATSRPPEIGGASRIDTAENSWRRAVLQVWVVLLARCTEREVSGLVSDHGIEIFVSLLGETCSESRFLMLLGLAVMIRWPAPRSAFLQSSESILFEFCYLLKTKSSAHDLDSLDPSLPELELLLLIALRGAANSRKNQDRHPAVVQPVLPCLLFRNFSGFLQTNFADLSPADLRTLQRLVHEVASISGSPARGLSSLLYSAPFETRRYLAPAAADQAALARSLQDDLGLLQKKLADNSLPNALPPHHGRSPDPAADMSSSWQSQSQSHSHSHSQSLSDSTISRQKHGIELSVPDLVPSLLLLTAYCLTPRPGLSPLASANVGLKRAMVVDALRQTFLQGGHGIKQKFLDRNAHLLAAALLHPHVAAGDANFAWLVLYFVCDVVSWGVVEAETPPGGVDPGSSFCDVLESTVDTIAVVSKTALFPDAAASHRWKALLQQHLLHAVLCRFRQHLAGGAQKPAVMAKFAAFCDVSVDVIKSWSHANAVPAPPPSTPGEATPTAPAPVDPQPAATDVFSPLSDLWKDAEDTDLFHLHCLATLHAPEPACLHVQWLADMGGSRSRANAVKGAADVELVWAVPQPVWVGPGDECLRAHAWMLEAVNDDSGPESPPTVLKAKLAGKPAAEAHGQVGEDCYKGAAEDVGSFVFWLFETMTQAVSQTGTTAGGRQSSTFPLRRFGRSGGSSELGVLRSVKRLAIEMLADWQYKCKHPLQPPAEAVSAFALTYLLKCVIPISGADGSAASESLFPTRDVWCSTLWIPICHAVSPQALLTLYTAKGDEEPTFTQQLIYNTCSRLRIACGFELFQLKRVWKYLVEAKASAVRKALMATVLPAALSLDKAKGRPDPTAASSSPLIQILAHGGTDGIADPPAEPEHLPAPTDEVPQPPRKSVFAAPASPAEDRWFQPAFTVKLVKSAEKATTKSMRRCEDHRIAALTKLVELGFEIGVRTGASSSFKVRLQRAAVRTRRLLERRAAAMQQFYRDVELDKIREKDARGIVGRLVLSRVMLQDLWGAASAIYSANPTEPAVYWRLDDVEGPDRMRVRLKRFLAKPLVKELGLLENGDDEAGAGAGEGCFPVEEGDDEMAAVIGHLFEPGMYGSDELGINDRKENRAVPFPCAQVTPMAKLQGELVLFSRALYFVSNESPCRDDLEPLVTQDDPLSASMGQVTGSRSRQTKKRMVQNMHLNAVRHRLTAHYSEVSGVFRRRYLLMNNSLEVFTEYGLAFFFSFESEAIRERVYASLLSLCPRAKEMSVTAENLKRWRDRWVQGKLTNFQYLMSLNTMAGRSFNDLTQYPIFPHVIADYTSETLDLSDAKSYRDLTRPMGALTEERRQKAARKYSETLEMYRMESPTVAGPGAASTRKPGFRLPGWGKKEIQDATDIDLYALPPYHHGTHFSNRATVLYYCVRLQPFTDYFCELNDLRMDVADRSFHNIDWSWRLSSAVSTTDVKELTPEFFYLPDFLVNTNKVKLGVKQDKVPVNHVELPPWAQNNPRVFVAMQRKALEGEHCSKHLHHWIDLIFGYKTTKDAAIEAYNCFHPFAYESAVNIDSIVDPVKRQSTIDIINNFGQMPSQLLTKPHPKRLVERIFGTKDHSWWQVGRLTRKICDAPFDAMQQNALQIVRTEIRRGTVRSLKVEGSSRESTTTRCIDSVAEEDAYDEVYSVPDSRILLFHASQETIGDGSTIGMDRCPAEQLQFLTWDNSVKMHLYDEGRQGKEVFVLRQSCRVDTIVTAATCEKDATHVALGTELGVIEVFRYGVSNVPTIHKKSGFTDAWAMRGDSEAFRFIPYAERDISPAPRVPASCAIASENDLRVRAMRPLATLHGHTDGVYSLVMSKEFNVILSGARDGLVIVWDLLELTYIRSMSPIRKIPPEATCETWSNTPARVPLAGESFVIVDINPLNGDIVAVSSHRRDNSRQSKPTYQLNLWNINGVVLACKLLEDQPTCTQFTGTLLAVGCANGKILLLNSFDLTAVSAPLWPRQDAPITALTVNDGQTKLYSSHLDSKQNSVVTTWMAAK